MRDAAGTSPETTMTLYSPLSCHKLSQALAEYEEQQQERNRMRRWVFVFYSFLVTSLGVGVVILAMYAAMQDAESLATQILGLTAGAAFAVGGACGVLGGTFDVLALHKTGVILCFAAAAVADAVRMFCLARLDRRQRYKGWNTVVPLMLLCVPFPMWVLSNCCRKRRDNLPLLLQPEPAGAAGDSEERLFDTSTLRHDSNTTAAAVAAAAATVVVMDDDKLHRLKRHRLILVSVFGFLTTSLGATIVILAGLAEAGVLLHDRESLVYAIIGGLPLTVAGILGMLGVRLRMERLMMPYVVLQIWGFVVTSMIILIRMVLLQTTADGSGSDPGTTTALRSTIFILLWLGSTPCVVYSVFIGFGPAETWDVRNFGKRRRCCM